MGLLGSAAGLAALALSGDFPALNCVTMLGVAVAGGLAVARVARPVDAGSARPAGILGGIFTALGFAVPYAAFHLWQWATLNADAVARRLADMGPAQVSRLKAAGLTPNLEYFIGESASYVAAYLFFGLLLGWLGGTIGAALAARAPARQPEQAGNRGPDA